MFLGCPVQCGSAFRIYEPWVAPLPDQIFHYIHITSIRSPIEWPVIVHVEVLQKQIIWLTGRILHSLVAMSYTHEGPIFALRNLSSNVDTIAGHSLNN
jgi:hypothetical protein